MLEMGNTQKVEQIYELQMTSDWKTLHLVSLIWSLSLTLTTNLE